MGHEGCNQDPPPLLITYPAWPDDQFEQTWAKICDGVNCNVDPVSGKDPDGATWMPMTATTGALITVSGRINVGVILQSTFTVSGSGATVAYTYTNKYTWTPSGITFTGICDLAYDTPATKLYISYGRNLAVAVATPLLTPSGSGGTLTFTVLTSAYTDCFQ